jgi:DNA polymerase
VGEQPGDREDREGAPFVGPAGALLDELMEEAGLDRRSVYVTNAVKHFKWEPRGKARIHKKPNAREIAACRPWLDAELHAIRPEAVVLLGATAAQALLGRDARIGREAGRVVPAPFAPYVLVTLHPAAVLRAPDAESRLAGRKRLLKDLAAVAVHLREKREP